MAVKQTGYDFWNNILKSPKYVAAPMVDMSELSFRMLCRSYGSDLCFTPMLHSQQFVQDSLYRQDTFSTCAEDRPLIIQFCANDPITFVNAASMVSFKCDGIDLNLGCPQAIAKKGHYGAFLQEDWECIHSIVKKAANELSVPVTCKMRILPGNFRKSVEYAKMLENSGCSVLTVHGRTRKQKGHATGLASWDVIKEIKANVKIPVIANGNILSFDDIKNCLEYTGADAVMSAEGLLHNPALFTGENPPVWEIVDEYLKLAERYSTSIRCVRCHLFKILYLCLHQDDNVRQILAEGSSYSDFYKVCNVLKNLPSKILKEYDGDGDVFDYDLHKLSDNLFDAHENRSEFITNCSSKLTKTDCDILSNHFFSSDDSDGSDSDIENGKSCLSAERTLANEVKKKCILNLPVWLCHSRPRITDNEETRGSYSHYFNLPEKTDCTNEERGLSKKKLRKLRRHERVLAAMKEKRKLQKLRRKLKIAELKQNQAPETNDVPKERVTKKQQKLLIKERLLKAQGSSPKVCINLGFASEMEKKDLSRLSSQLRRLYGSNRHSNLPLHLIFCNFSSSDELYQICQRKNDGFSSYVVDMSEKAPEELYETEDLIYLSPDAEDVLTTLDSSKVYVIGGIVDGTVKKGLSLNHAKNLHIKTVRLPISEHLVKCSQNPGTTVLTVNQVFDILLKYHETKDWTEALSCNVPSRKGFCAPSDANRAKQRVLSNTEDILNPTEIHNESKS